MLASKPWAGPRISFEEFLRLEEVSASKHEWLDGIMYMMAGGTFEHGRLVADVLTPALLARDNPSSS